jgi:hypothetical protein
MVARLVHLILDIPQVAILEAERLMALQRFLDPLFGNYLSLVPAALVEAKVADSAYVMKRQEQVTAAEGQPAQHR